MHTAKRSRGPRPDQTTDIDNMDSFEIEKPLKMNYSQLKKASKGREIPVLNEDELEEAFIRGEVIPWGTLDVHATIFRSRWRTRWSIH